MARTYKVYGCAHDSSGSLDVTVSVGGNEVFNGSITADVDDHSDPLLVSNIFSFDVDDSITGNQNWNVTVTGTDDSSQIHISHMECNNVRPNMAIELEYFTDKINAMEDPSSDAFEASVQTHIANTIGETALGSTVYNKLIAGTSVPATDARVVMEANEQAGLDANHYYEVEGAFTSVQIDGDSYDTSSPGTTIPVGNGETMTLTWDMTPQTFEYDPPLPA